MPEPKRPADDAPHPHAASRADRLAAARALEAAVAANPDDIGARHHLAMAWIELGEPQAALTHLQRVVELQPDAVPPLNNLGAVLEQLERHPEAIDCYRRAVALAPALAVPHVNLGEALCRAGRLDEATSVLRIAATLDPDLADAWAALGSCLLAAGTPRSALGALRRTVALAPGRARSWRELGDALQSLREFRDAMACYEQATLARPEDPDLWFCLGSAHAACGQHAAAARAFERCDALAGGHAAATHELGKACFELGCVERAMVLLRRAAALGNAALRATALENLAIVVPGSPDDDGRSIRATREEYARSRPETPQFSFAPAARSGPLRIGYVSSFFHQAHWMKPVWALLRHHDRRKVQVHLFVDGPREAFQAGCALHPEDRVHELDGTTNAEAARRIHAQDLDVLVDLNGYSAPARLPLYLLRPARVQVGWFNLYATSGMPCFDALVGDADVVRPDEEPDYTERILRVPHSCLTFQVDHPAPDVEPAPHLANGWFTLGSLASLYKLTDATIRTWAAILTRCPDARLLLRNSGLGPIEHQEHLAARFAGHGVTRERLMLAGPAPHREFLATYGYIDLALDPFPYSGGTTTMEALWQGVPVVTFDGDRWASRTSVSLLRAAGLDGFVARDAADFVGRCVALAHDPGPLAALRGDLRERLRNSPVCDAAAFARAMESLYAGLATQPRLRT